jgi:hypothetical protein
MMAKWKPEIDLPERRKRRGIQVGTNRYSSSHLQKTKGKAPESRCHHSGYLTIG